MAKDKRRTQQQLAKQQIARVLHDSGCDRTSILLDARRALCFGCLVDRQELA